MRLSIISERATCRRNYDFICIFCNCEFPDGFGCNLVVTLYRRTVPCQAVGVVTVINLVGAWCGNRQWRRCNRQRSRRPCYALVRFLNILAICINNCVLLSKGSVIRVSVNIFAFCWSVGNFQSVTLYQAFNGIVICTDFFSCTCNAFREYIPRLFYTIISRGLTINCY